MSLAAITAARSINMAEGSDHDSAGLFELSQAEQFAALQVGRELTRIAMIFPLRVGAGDRARALAAAGPPVDPAGWAIEEYDIFVTDSEVTFVFETCDDRLLERLVHGHILSTATAEWREIGAGAPHVARADYSWSRPQNESTGLVFTPTPGPGDSEGGDVFPP